MGGNGCRLQGYERTPSCHALVCQSAKAMAFQPTVGGRVCGGIARGNQPNKARQFWRYILSRFKPNVAGDGKLTIENNQAFERRYAELVRLYLGANAGEKWLQWLQQNQGRHNREFSEFRIAWFLAQQRQAQSTAELGKAEKKGIAIPLWQRLGVAMANNDVPATRKILASYASGLDKLDQISALRTIGSDQAALDTTHKLIKYTAK